MTKRTRPWACAFVALVIVGSNASLAAPLATAGGRSIVSERDLETMLSKLSEDERTGFLSSPQRVLNMTERLALARATKTRADQLSSAERSALELERDLAGYGFMKRVWVDAEFKRTVTESAVRQRADELYKLGHASCQASEKFDVSHILIRMDNKSFTEATASVQKTIDRLKQGEAFEKVAQSVSEDDSSAAAGGKLPTFTRQEVNPLFARNAIGKRELGIVNGPFLTPFGIHVARLDRVNAPTQNSAADCMPSLTRIAELELRQNAVIEVEKELYAKAKLELNQEAIAALAKKNTPERVKLTPELIQRIEAMAAEQRNADLKASPELETKK